MCSSPADASVAPRSSRAKSPLFSLTTRDAEPIVCRLSSQRSVPMRDVVILLLLAFVAVARAQSSPFVGPPFAGQCTVHHFGEGVAPPLDACTDDPLCVEYDKRDITASNGGAVDFLAAEP